ncbi:putative cyclic nucleotide-gated ion channel 12 [Cardamine amara subsp. amara]|uniref:Cyclic nucleotide-gated ion channel 12 n=1 Tax=Cardamine amara subsp. amara TaxID=228776 RepID=A0ABD1C7Z9_CARAN
MPRIIRILPLYKEVTRTSHTISESHWAGAALNLFLFLMYSYVFGAFWYVIGVQKKVSCWRDACRRTQPDECILENLFGPKSVDNSLFLNTSCPLIDPDEITNSSTKSSNIYDFGMYIEVLKSGVAEVKPRDFPRKFVFCFWWGLRNLRFVHLNSQL